MSHFVYKNRRILVLDEHEFMQIRWPFPGREISRTVNSSEESRALYDHWSCLTGHCKTSLNNVSLNNVLKELWELWEVLHGWKSVQAGRRPCTWRWADMPEENCMLTCREQWAYQYSSHPPTCHWPLTFFRVKFKAFRTHSLFPVSSSVTPHVYLPLS